MNIINLLSKSAFHYNDRGVCQQIWKTQQWPQDWKRPVFIPIPKRGNAKECLNNCTIATSQTLVMLNIPQARLQQCVNHELPDVQAGFRKGRGTRDQIASIHWFRKSKRIPEKQSTSASLTMLNPMTVWITTNWEIHKAMGIPDHFTFLLRNMYAGRSRSNS